MKCCQCHKEIEHELDMIFVTIDGDVVCNKKCEAAWKKEKDHFLNVVIHDDALYKDWMENNPRPRREDIGL